MLEEFFVAFISGALILDLMPGPVGKNEIHGFKNIADKRMSCDGNALLGQPSVDHMGRFEAGHDDVQPFQFSCSRGNPGVMIVGKTVGRRDWMHYLPGLRRSAGDIHGQQSMQKCGAGPWKSGNKQRTSDDLIANLRAPPAILLQKKPVAKHAKNIAVSADPPD
jgi:hypothetical protein